MVNKVFGLVQALACEEWLMQDETNDGTHELFKDIEERSSYRSDAGCTCNFATKASRVRLLKGHSLTTGLVESCDSISHDQIEQM